MESKWKGGKEPEFSFELPNSTAKAYNENFDGMKSNLRKLHSGEKEKYSYRTTLILLFVVRFMCFYTAWFGNVYGTLAIR